MFFKFTIISLGLCVYIVEFARSIVHKGHGHRSGNHCCVKRSAEQIMPLAESSSIGNSNVALISAINRNFTYSYQCPKDVSNAEIMSTLRNMKAYRKMVRVRFLGAKDFLDIVALRRMLKKLESQIRRYYHCVEERGKDGIAALWSKGFRYYRNRKIDRIRGELGETRNKYCVGKAAEKLRVKNKSDTDWSKDKELDLYVHILRKEEELDKLENEYYANWS